MNIGAVLPHLMVFGGVRRYIEIGNIFNTRGHRFTIYTPEGAEPSWMRFAGEVKPIDALRESDFDILITGTPEFTDLIRSLKAKVKIFYLQIEDLKEEGRIVCEKDLHIMVNSSGLRRHLRKRYALEPLDGIGGVDPVLFNPGEAEDPELKCGPGEGKLNLLCYGRFSRPRKGTRFVVKAAGELYKKGYNVELHLFDSSVEGSSDARIRFDPGLPFRFYSNISQDALASVYRGADIFVSAEHRAGWSNTAAEAAASGLPVITTGSGTSDFAIDGESAIVIPFRSPRCIRREVERLCRDAGLRIKLGKNARKMIETYSWERLCGRMEAEFKKLLEGTGSSY
ncbi:MAG: glycosyltransferase family 4 protein [Candidatus Krumholzibacteriota bacterium]|nr:glycosyltransferase family 4 protein [Candidatus Krumholzibacteriota bacterium]